MHTWNVSGRNCRADAMAGQNSSHYMVRRAIRMRLISAERTVTSENLRELNGQAMEKPADGKTTIKPGLHPKSISTRLKQGWGDAVIRWHIPFMA